MLAAWALQKPAVTRGRAGCAPGLSLLRVVNCNYPQPPRGGCARLHSLPISDLWGLGTLAGAQASGLRKQVEPAGVSCLGGSELIIVLSPKALGKFGERIQFVAPPAASYRFGFAKPHQAFALADWPQDPVQFATTGLASWGRLRAGEMH